MSSRIVVTCSTGVGTSKAVANKLSKLLIDRGYDVEIIPTNTEDIESKLQGACVYVPLTIPDKDLGVPVVLGYPFLVGDGQDKALDEIIHYITNK